MKKYLLLGLSLIFIIAQVNPAGAVTRVGGYMKKNGTYVMPSYRTDADSYKFNNYSSKGNYNPYSTKKGYKKW